MEISKSSLHDMSNHVMQTYKDKNIPKHWKESYDAWKSLPDISHTLMTDDDNLNLIKDHYPQHLEKYLAFEYPIQRVDFARYAYAHKFGGIYSDLDIVPRKDIREFIKEGELFVLPSANVPSIFTNAFFVAKKPGLKFFEDLMNNIDGETAWWHFDKHQQVMHTTGPNMFTNVLKSGNYQYTVLPYKVIQPYSVCDYEHDSDSVLDIVEGSSWMNQGTKNLYHNAFCMAQEDNQWLLGLLLVLVIILVLVFMCFYVYSRILNF